MGSSPAQSHSTRHTHAATNPVGHSGDGFEPCAHPTGSPATREVLRPHCCVISATLDPVSPPCPRAEGLRPSYHQGEPSSQRQRGDGGWAAWGMFCFSKAAFPAGGGWGRCPDPQPQPPPGEAPSQLQSRRNTGTMEAGGEKGGGEGPARQRPCGSTPGLLPSSRCSSLSPEAPKELSTVSLGGRRMTRVLEGSYNTSTQGLARPSTRCPNRSAMPP